MEIFILTIALIFITNAISSPIIIQNIYTFQDYQFYGAVCIGSQKQLFNMVFDTTQEWSWVNSVQCSSCITSKLDCSASITCNASEDQVDVSLIYHQYLVGNITSDLLNLSYFQVSNFLFLLVTISDYYSSGDGTIGLNINSFIKDGIVAKLYQKKIISNRVVGILLQWNNKESKIEIGDYSEQYTSMHTLWVPVMSKEYWMFRIDQLEYDEIRVENATGVIDSGLQWIIMPYSILLAIIRRVSKKIACELRYPYNFQCIVDSANDYAAFEEISLVINKEVLILNPADYVIIMPGASNYIAYVKLYGWDKDYILLGAIFIKNYYIKLDSESMQIGFVMLRGINKERVVIYIGMIAVILILIMTILIAMRIKRFRAVNGK